ncbi:hypothetical protein L1887_35799 [Cichorium endivia]|nr:hypothetical protein L1887_35799 [Cichorium endivia]
MVIISSGGEIVEELDHSWPRTMAGWATSRSQRHNLVAQRLNLCCLAFLSLLLLISIASADEVSFEDHYDDKGECPSVASDLKKVAKIDGRRVK